MLRHAERDPIGIYIYRDGVRVATHKISRLAKRPHLVTMSISHVDWIRDAPVVLDASAFTITTSSFRDVTFETKTGALVREADSAVWTRCDDIVAGKLDLPNGALRETYSLETKKRAATIAFVPDANVALTHKASTTACLERQSGKLVLTEVL